MTVKETVEEKICPIINELGYDVIEVEYSKKVNGWNLSFIIDKNGGILIEDCEKVHRAINEPLDLLNPTNEQQYTLNVSSPGLDRPVKNAKDFARNFEKEVEVKLFAPLNGKKSFTGLLVEFDDKIVSIKILEEKITFERKIVAIIQPIIKF